MNNANGRRFRPMQRERDVPAQVREVPLMTRR
jgi:hypothetical protein